MQKMGNPQNGSPKLSCGLVYSQLVRKSNLTLALTQAVTLNLILNLTVVLSLT